MVVFLIMKYIIEKMNPTTYLIIQPHPKLRISTIKFFDEMILQMHKYFYKMSNFFFKFFLAEFSTGSYDFSICLTCTINLGIYLQMYKFLIIIISKAGISTDYRQILIYDFALECTS